GKSLPRRQRAPFAVDAAGCEAGRAGQLQQQRPGLLGHDGRRADSALQLDLTRCPPGSSRAGLAVLDLALLVAHHLEPLSGHRPPQPFFAPRAPRKSARACLMREVIDTNFPSFADRAAAAFFSADPTLRSTWAFSHTLFFFALTLVSLLHTSFRATVARPHTF